MQGVECRGHGRRADLHAGEGAGDGAAVDAGRAGAAGGGGCVLRGDGPNRDRGMQRLPAQAATERWEYAEPFDSCSGQAGGGMAGPARAGSGPATGGICVPGIGFILGVAVLRGDAGAGRGVLRAGGRGGRTAGRKDHVPTAPTRSGERRPADETRPAPRTARSRRIALGSKNGAARAIRSAQAARRPFPPAHFDATATRRTPPPRAHADAATRHPIHRSPRKATHTSRRPAERSPTTDGNISAQWRPSAECDPSSSARNQREARAPARAARAVRAFAGGSCGSIWHAAGKIAEDERLSDVSLLTALLKAPVIRPFARSGPTIPF